ncbi:MAG: hypothetical protein HY691_11700 [Chloroflexi bacterium]|nr:hypothetical protein [Chloroflexota bacterium]
MDVATSEALVIDQGLVGVLRRFVYWELRQGESPEGVAWLLDLFAAVVGAQRRLSVDVRRGLEGVLADVLVEAQVVQQAADDWP